MCVDAWLSCVDWALVSWSMLGMLVYWVSELGG
jgi:hypothetical protein